MTRIIYRCETSNNELEILTFDDFIELTIDTGKNIYHVHLTLKDSKKLMEDIHQKIIQIEGGKK